MLDQLHCTAPFIDQKHPVVPPYASLYVSSSFPGHPSPWIDSSLGLPHCLTVQISVPISSLPCLPLFLQSSPPSSSSPSSLCLLPIVPPAPVCPNAVDQNGRRLTGPFLSLPMAFSLLAGMGVLFPTLPHWMIRPMALCWLPICQSKCCCTTAVVQGWGGVSTWNAVRPWHSTSQSSPGVSISPSSYSVAMKSTRS